MRISITSCLLDNEKALYGVHTICKMQTIKFCYQKKSPEFDIFVEEGPEEWMKLSKKQLMRINVHLPAPTQLLQSMWK